MKTTTSRIRGDSGNMASMPELGIHHGEKSMAVRKLVTLAFMGVLLMTTLASPVYGQEAGALEIQTTAGGYEISVEEFASNLSVGSSQIIVTLRDAGTGQGIDDAQVVVRAKHDLNGEEGWVTALNFPNDPDRYKAQVSLTAPGTWRLWVEIDGRLGRVEVEILPLEVPVLRSYSTGSFIFIGVFMVMVLGAAYLWWSSQKALRQREATRRSPDESDQEQGPGANEAGAQE